MSLNNYINNVVTAKFIKPLKLVFLTKFKHTTMKSMKHKFLVFFVAIFAVALFASQTVSAACAAGKFVTIDKVGVNGINSNQGGTIGVFAGETIPLRVFFTACETIENKDITVFARLGGTGTFADVTDRIDIVKGSSYSIPLKLKLPFNIDPDEVYELKVAVEIQGGHGDNEVIQLRVQRESYLVEIFSVESADEVKAGETLALDVVLKNRGRHEAEDTYVRATIPELGVSKTVFFGDLSPEDQGENEKGGEGEDSVERTMSLNIPRSARAGVYTVELEAFNADSSATSTKKVVVVDAGQESRVISSGTSKTFAVGEQKSYSVLLVNTGNEVKVYELVVEAPSELKVELDEQVVVVPAGSSKTVKANVVASEQGTYNFAVSVHSDGELVKREEFSATVKGRSAAINPAIVLTVVLAIIFVVLVIVLIVLLTKKPEKKEEYGESYY